MRYEKEMMERVCKNMGIKMVSGIKAPMLKGKELTLDELVDMSPEAGFFSECSCRVDGVGDSSNTYMVTGQRKDFYAA